MVNELERVATPNSKGMLETCVRFLGSPDRSLTKVLETNYAAVLHMSEYFRLIFPFTTSQSPLEPPKSVSPCFGASVYVTEIVVPATEEVDAKGRETGREMGMVPGGLLGNLNQWNMQRVSSSSNTQL